MPFFADWTNESDTDVLHKPGMQAISIKKLLQSLSRAKRAMSKFLWTKNIKVSKLKKYQL